MELNSEILRKIERSISVSLIPVPASTVACDTASNSKAVSGNMKVIFQSSKNGSSESDIVQSKSSRMPKTIEDCRNNRDSHVVINNDWNNNRNSQVVISNDCSNNRDSQVVKSNDCSNNRDSQVVKSKDCCNNRDSQVVKSKDCSSNKDSHSQVVESSSPCRLLEEKISRTPSEQVCRDTSNSSKHCQENDTQKCIEDDACKGSLDNNAEHCNNTSSFSASQPCVQANNFGFMQQPLLFAFPVPSSALGVMYTPASQSTLAYQLPLFGNMPQITQGHSSMASCNVNVLSGCSGSQSCKDRNNKVVSDKQSPSNASAVKMDNEPLQHISYDADPLNSADTDGSSDGILYVETRQPNSLTDKGSLKPEKAKQACKSDDNAYTSQISRKSSHSDKYFPENNKSFPSQPKQIQISLPILPMRSEYALIRTFKEIADAHSCEMKLDGVEIQTGQLEKDMGLFQKPSTPKLACTNVRRRNKPRSYLPAPKSAPPSKKLPAPRRVSPAPAKRSKVGPTPCKELEHQSDDGSSILHGLRRQLEACGTQVKSTESSVPRNETDSVNEIEQYLYPNVILSCD